MKKVLSIVVLLSMIASFMVKPSGKVAYAAAIGSFPTETYEIIHGNPSMGMVFEPNVKYNDKGMQDLISNRTIPSETDMVQIYFHWSNIEPTDDNFDWTSIDAAINSIAAQGKKAIIRADFGEGEDSIRWTFAPAWLWGKGVQYRILNNVQDFKQPYYYDAIWLSELQEALNAFGARYNNNPNIEYIDLRNTARCGEWGGWGNADGFPWQSRAQQKTTLRTIIDYWAAAFPNKRLMMPDAGQAIDGTPDESTNEMRRQNWAYDYALDNHSNWGLRSDTVMAWHWDINSSEFTQWLLKNEWRKHMFVHEGSSWWHPEYMLSNKQQYIDNALSMHTNVSVFNNAGYDDWNDFLSAWDGYWQQLSLNAGYRFVLTKADYNSKVQPGGNLTITQTWINKGVGRCPDKYPLKVYFTNQSTGEIVWSGVDNAFDQTGWEKWNIYDVNSEFTLPANLATGTYDLKIAMVDSNGNPKITLPITNGSNKMYKIGTIQVAQSQDSYTVPQLGGSVMIEAEDFTTQSGLELIYNGPDGFHDAIGYCNTGDWLEYNFVKIPSGGDYTLEIRAAATLDNQKVKLMVDGVDKTGDITLPVTGSHDQYTTSIRKITGLTSGTHVVKLLFSNAGGACDINWFKLSKINTAEAFKIEFEDWSTQSGLERFYANDVDGTNAVGYCNTGDFAQYSSINVPKTGDYSARFRVAATTGDQSFRLEVDGVDKTGTITIPNTGSHTAFTYIDKTINLTAGQHTFKVVMVNAGGYCDLNWMEFSYKPSVFSKTIQCGDYTRPSSDSSGNTNIFKMTVNDGGNSTGLGYCNTGEDVIYDSVYIPCNGTYTAEFRVQTTAVGQQFKLYVDGDDVTGTLSPNTYGTWSTVSVPVKLSKGNHKLKLYMVNAGGSINFNWMRFTLQ